jgi:4-hydroxybenzoate polyprenyltransferase
MGVLAAAQVSTLSALIALIVAGLAVLYNAWGKRQRLFGPLNMGLCRGGNLLLGVSAVPAAVTSLWSLSLIPIVYIAAITMISRGEVHGGNRAALWGGVGMYTLVIGGLLALAIGVSVSVEVVVPFLLLLGFLIYPPLLRALRSNEPRLIGLAVKAGVLSLIVLDAAIAATFGGWVYGLLVLLLLPLSRWLATRFAVT